MQRVILLDPLGFVQFFRQFPIIARELVGEKAFTFTYLGGNNANCRKSGFYTGQSALPCRNIFSQEIFILLVSMIIDISINLL
jgi:hypothetical protein